MAFSISPTFRSLLLPTNHQSNARNIFNASLLMENTTWMIKNTTSTNFTNLHRFSAYDVKVQYAFLLPGVLFGIAFIGHILLAVSTRCSLKPLFHHEEKSASSNSCVNVNRLARWRTNLMLITFGVISANIGSIEETTSMHLFDFSVKHLDWTELDAGSTEVMLGVSTIVALVTSVVISMFVPSSIIMGILQFGMLASTVALICLPLVPHLFIFYVSVILYGLSFGPASSTMVSWMSKVLRASGKLISYYFTMMYIGRLSIGLLFSYLFESNGAVWFTYMNMIMVGAAMLAYVFTIFLADVRSITNKDKRNRKQEDMTKTPMMNKPSSIISDTECI